MENTKIVQKIGSIVLAIGVSIGSVACSSNKVEANGTTVENPTNIFESVNSGQSGMNTETNESGSVIVNTETVTTGESGSGVENTETNTSGDTANEEETEKDTDFIYDPIDFSKVEDDEARYELILKERDRYYNHLKSVLRVSSLHTKEEIAAAIYSVVRLDNDLSSLLRKIYNNKKAEIDGMKYYADQIEALEAIFNKMKQLETMITEAEDLYKGHLSKLDRADADQIKRVKKYTLMPLQAPMQQLEVQIEELKTLLEQALDNQT